MRDLRHRQTTPARQHRARWPRRDALIRTSAFSVAGQAGAVARLLSPPSTRKPAAAMERRLATPVRRSEAPAMEAGAVPLEPPKDGSARGGWFLVRFP